MSPRLENILHVRFFPRQNTFSSQLLAFSCPLLKVSFLSRKSLSSQKQKQKKTKMLATRDFFLQTGCCGPRIVHTVLVWWRAHHPHTALGKDLKVLLWAKRKHVNFSASTPAQEREAVLGETFCNVDCNKLSLDFKKRLGKESLCLKDTLEFQTENKPRSLRNKKLRWGTLIPSAFVQVLGELLGVGIVVAFVENKPNLGFYSRLVHPDIF